MKLKNISIALVLLAGMAGCELAGDLDKMTPPYKMIDKNVISDASTAEASLNGIYTSWRSEWIGASREYLNALSGTSYDTQRLGIDEFTTNNIKPDNYVIQYIYPGLYFVVNNATSFLYNLEKAEPVSGLSQERKAEMRGEARYLRAQAYLTILRSFGEFYDLASKYGIVLYDERPPRDNEPMPRGTVAESYKAILDDLDYAVKYAPANQPLHYKVSALTAKALKARVMLYMKKFDEAAKLANEVIAEAPAKGYALEEDFRTMFQNGWESSEMLFALYSTAPDEYYTYMGSFATAKTIRKIAASLVKGKTDKRFAEMFPEIDPLTAEYGTIYNYKYPSGFNDVKQSSHYYIRLGEMYYIAAESLARSGRVAEARQALKDILCLPRAGYTEAYVNNIPQNDLLKTIMEQKWMELASENNEEWFDLVRYHAWDKFPIAPGYVASDAHLLLPIPRPALTANNKLEQNPGY